MHGRTASDPGRCGQRQDQHHDSPDRVYDRRVTYQPVPDSGGDLYQQGGRSDAGPCRSTGGRRTQHVDPHLPFGLSADPAKACGSSGLRHRLCSIRSDGSENRSEKHHQGAGAGLQEVQTGVFSGRYQQVQGAEDLTGGVSAGKRGRLQGKMHLRSVFPLRKDAEEKQRHGL